MKKLTPFGVVLVCGLIGLLTGKFGLWFPLGLAAAAIVAVAQTYAARGKAKDEAKTPD
ncbi:hypothetical protein [Brevundimonas sp. SORGH_AS_0993]|uniref:hypothetical protein n=1 Tax=Brevundimonas sp. SORGH_AS_0993 TaxID=3041794 RepID=UPI00277D1F08|nr:hypothetical protein [Brevundimonas sp. SORGH_AS_0993]MDQ1155387.1 hypothetical protein [Brevundimonas sp. SORGH_AS_0993]